MPLFTLHRTFVLRTNKGHSIRFVKGEPTWVPPLCIEDVVAIGAIPQEGVDVLPPEAGPVLELTAEERQKKLFEAFDQLMARHDRGDFTASNQPHCKKLQSITGFEVAIAERDDAWRKYRVQQEEAGNNLAP
jgi:hypothetical protein